MAPEKPATNDVHPVRNAASAAVGFSKIHVLTAGVGAQRSELGIGHRPSKRQQAASQPGPQHRPRARHRLGHEGRHEENAATDDIRHHDGGTIERAELAQESRSRRSDRRSGCEAGRLGLGHAAGWPRGWVTAYGLLGQELSFDLKFAELHQLRPAVLDEQLDVHVHEKPVPEHFQARLLASVTKVGLKHDRRRHRA